MTWAHVHLALNHVPVVGIVLAILLLGAAVVQRGEQLTRASYWLLVVLALITMAVYFTGEPAEELVEKLPGYSESLVEHHEEVALLATIGMGILGLAAAVGLLRGRRQTISKRYSRVVLLLGILVAGLMGWTANLGGQIRHSEIRPEAQATVPTRGDKD